MAEFNFQNQDINQSTQQLQYPLDYVSQQIIKEFVKGAYPIGTIYTSVTSTNPNTTFGFGTWSSFGSGRCLVGVDSGQTEFDTVEETGGAKTHTLTSTEMPAHTHTGVYTTNGGGISNPGSGGGFQVGTSDSTGGGQAHNNLQPYITVYFWKRIA